MAPVTSFIKGQRLQWLKYNNKRRGQYYQNSTRELRERNLEIDQEKDGPCN